MFWLDTRRGNTSRSFVSIFNSFGSITYSSCLKSSAAFIDGSVQETIPPLPLQPLGINDIVSPVNYWPTHRQPQKDVLPVFADLLFRLLHNGLSFRLKFGWHTQDINCVHGVTEIPKHLLWDCYIAKSIWRLFLAPFERIFDNRFRWEQTLFLVDLTVPGYRQHQFCSLLPIRCCIFHTLWINRNKAIYDAPCLHFMGIFRQCLTMIRLHLQQTFKGLTQLLGTRSSLIISSMSGINTFVKIQSAFSL
ncbi:hypothetical protein Plhal304r1_c003g0010421 [Plasmopara halstedii]